MAAQCHFQTYEEVLDRQQGMWDKLRADATEQEWTSLKIGIQGGSGLTAFNEIVLQSVPSIFAFYWAHDGDFITPMAYDGRGSELTAICCIALQFCPNPPEQPLIEMAHQTIRGNGTSLTWSEFSSYKTVMLSSGGYDPSSIFRLLPWSEVCETAFLNKCNQDSDRYSQCIPS